MKKDKTDLKTKTVDELRKAIKKEKLLWRPNKKLKKSDPLPSFPMGGELEKEPSVIPVATKFEN
jgi:hypothetical protein